MEYYVISPNVHNDGVNRWQEMYDLQIAAVGWSTDDKKGKQFSKIEEGDCIIVALRQNWNWKYYYMGIVNKDIDNPSIGSIEKKLYPIIDLKDMDLEFDKWSANGSNQIPSPQRITKEDNQLIIKLINTIMNRTKYTDLLKANMNLILTGAPGTGKTYLSKQIAAQMILGGEYNKNNVEHKAKMDEQFDFVQFHPSFDYTDFVEGLRPDKDEHGNIVFKREDGIFMDFCRKALKAYNEAENKDDAPKYIFVIDEINRGELSKIFGELFFSIDPGYRGSDGKVKTQYSNLWKSESDMFDGGKSFYIPKNVYIIGTMNDIDRSVESMDFAMRRRFAFQEIDAQKSFSMIEKSAKLSVYSDQIKERMENLNNCILTIQGLNTAYQIGAAYFLKLEYYLDDSGQITPTSWISLWDNHIKGLLFEYLRGLPNAESDITKLKDAYDLNKRYKVVNDKIGISDGDKE